MRLFAFGLGFSACHLAALFPAITLSGTCRTQDKQQKLVSQGIKAVLYDDADAVAAQLAEADTVLISIPPAADIGDVVLHHYHDWIAAHRDKYYLYLSTTGIYGNHHGAWVDEDTQPTPTAARSKYRLSAERQWQELIANITIFRLAGIYGPERNVLAGLQNGTIKYAVTKYDADANPQIFSRIHVTDIAYAIVFAVRNQLSGIYNLCDDTPCPPDEVIQYGAKLLGLAPVAVKDYHEIVDSLSPMAQSFYQDNKRVSNRKIKQAGFQLHHPDYRSGLDAVHHAAKSGLSFKDSS